MLFHVLRHPLLYFLIKLLYETSISPNFLTNIHPYKGEAEDTCSSVDIPVIYSDSVSSQSFSEKN